MRERFWERYPLDQLDHDEWEALCDGCGRCCLVKLEDEDTGEHWFTDVSCRYLNTATCRCTTYGTRAEVVPDCLRVTPRLARDFAWLPETCAYRLLARGEALPAWHPLITGTRHSVVEAGISVRDRVTSEALVPEEALEERIVHWVR